MKDKGKEYIRSVFPEVEQIRDPGLAEKVVATLWEESELERIEDIPIKAKNPKTSLVTHIRFVARASGPATVPKGGFHDG